jgi:hypothetical protein
MKNMTQRIPRPEVVKMLCAIPPDVRAWVEAQAAYHLAPMNSVIVAAVRAQMDAERQGHEKVVAK